MMRHRLPMSAMGREPKFAYGWKPALAMVANLRVGGGTIDVGVSQESERDNGVLTSWIADFYRT